MADLPIARPCACGGQPGLGVHSCFILIGCQSCGRETDLVTTVYQNDDEAYAQAVRLWNEGLPDAPPPRTC